MNQTIEIDSASAGMTLGAAVANGHGSSLLAAGSVLTATTLVSLRRRGVTALVIVSEPTEAHPPIALPDTTAIEARQDFLFRFYSGQVSAALHAALRALKLPGAA